jgi:hypothetical protein
VASSRAAPDHEFSLQVILLFQALLLCFSPSVYFLVDVVARRTAFAAGFDGSNDG